MHLEKIRRVAPIVVFVGLVAAGLIYLTVVSVKGNGPLTASGTIEAVEVSVASEVSGRVAEVLVSEGASVEAGDVLLRLDSRLLEAQRELTLAADQASVAAADLELVNAQQALEDLHENAPLAAAAAELALANARDALDDAERLNIYQQKGNRATKETIDGAEAQLTLAEQAVKRAEAAYNRTSRLPEDNPTRASARASLEAARRQRDAAERNVNWYKGAPSDIDQAILDAKVGVAQAQLGQAERDAEDLIPGPDPDLLAQAKARLTLAQAQLAAAQQAQADLELSAPFDGIVCNLKARVGEWMTPGVPVLQLGDLARLQVETTDLNEIDAARLRLGDRAMVTFDALPIAGVGGTVQRIGFKSAEGSGVNYTVILQLDEIPDGLRWGMTAFVDIEVEK